jgi:hypothetical protein
MHRNNQHDIHKNKKSSPYLQKVAQKTSKTHVKTRKHNLIQRPNSVTSIRTETSSVSLISSDNQIMKSGHLENATRKANRRSHKRSRSAISLR